MQRSAGRGSTVRRTSEGHGHGGLARSEGRADGGHQQRQRGVVAKNRSDREARCQRHRSATAKAAAKKKAKAKAQALARQKAEKKAVKKSAKKCTTGRS